MNFERNFEKYDLINVKKLIYSPENTALKHG